MKNFALEGKGVKVKAGFVLREVGGQTVVIATGEASENFHGMIKCCGEGNLERAFGGAFRGRNCQKTKPDIYR